MEVSMHPAHLKIFRGASKYLGDAERSCAKGRIWWRPNLGGPFAVRNEKGKNNNSGKGGTCLGGMHLGVAIKYLRVALYFGEFPPRVAR